MSRNPKNLPKSAKKVFTGKIFDVYQWEQELYDGSKSIFERVARVDTVVVIATTPDEKILILNEEQPDKKSYISLPGGRMDEGETPLEAIKRELKEETGYSAGSWQLLSEFKPVHKMHWSVYTFIARGCVKAGEPTLDPGEKIKLKKLTFEQFLKLVDEERFREPQLKMQMLKCRYQKSEKIKLKKLLFKS